MAAKVGDLERCSGISRKIRDDPLEVMTGRTTANATAVVVLAHDLDYDNIHIRIDAKHYGAWIIRYCIE